MKKHYHGLYAGNPVEVWDAASDHSAHVHSIGTYQNGIETSRVRVVLATRIPENVCRQINLGYRDPHRIRIEDFQNREAEGILHVPQTGERLYHLLHKPTWAGGTTT